MSETEDKLKADLEKAKDINLNLRFDNVEKQLIEIKEILKESNILSKAEIEELKHSDLKLSERIAILEEHRRFCPIISLKHEVKRYGLETSFVRGLFKNPWKGGVLLTLFIIIITTLILVFGPETVFQTLLKVKGL